MLNGRDRDGAADLAGTSPSDSPPGVALDLRGVSLAVTAQVMAGSSFVAVSALDEYPIAAGQGARYGVAALVLAVFAFGRVPMPTRGDLVRLAAISLLGLAVFNALVIVAVADSDPAAVGVIVGCVPVVLAVLGPLQLGRRVQPSLIGAAAVVAVGAALVQWTGGGTSTRAIVLAVGALLCEAAFTLLAVPVLPRLGAYGVTLWACVLSVPMLGGWALLVDGPASFRAPTGREAVALGWLVVGVTLIAILAWFAAVHRLGAHIAGFFNGLMPVSAAVAGAATATVVLTPIRILGTAMVALGITIGMIASREGEPATPGTMGGPPP